MPKLDCLPMHHLNYVMQFAGVPSVMQLSELCKHMAQDPALGHLVGRVPGLEVRAKERRSRLAAEAPLQRSLLLAVAERRRELTQKKPRFACFAHLSVARRPELRGW